MQVQSRSKSFNQAPRPSGADRKAAESEVTDVAARSRRDDAITGSSAVLSTSLADALWAIQRTSGIEDNTSVATVENLYRAYAV
jgi:hypothetical protein